MLTIQIIWRCASFDGESPGKNGEEVLWFGAGEGNTKSRFCSGHAAPNLATLRLLAAMLAGRPEALCECVFEQPERENLISKRFNRTVC